MFTWCIFRRLDKNEYEVDRRLGNIIAGRRIFIRRKDFYFKYFRELSWELVLVFLGSEKLGLVCFMGVIWIVV